MLFFFKASAIPAGARWITVRPHGDDAKGQPVLIQPQPDGSAKVIGGAGGSLNHLRLSGVKKEGDYAAAIRARAEHRKESRKAQRERDKQLGIQSSKAEAHARITEQTSEARRNFIHDVADAMGWDRSEVAFDESKVADEKPEVVAKLRQAHETEVLKRAQDAVRLNRERLLGDADARAEADLGEIPLDAESADALSVQDLDPVKKATGLGFATEYRERAEAQGLTPDTLAAELEGVKKPLSEGARKAAVARGETARLVQENLEQLRDGDDVAKLAPKLLEAKQALALLKLDKKRKLIEKQAREARKKINESVVEPKAYVLSVDDADVDEKVSADVMNDLRTISTRAFLSEVAKFAPNPHETLGRHVGVGAFNSVNALALAAGGAALVDRSVVDVLGVAGAAEVLSRRLASDLDGDELKTIADGMEDFHLHHYVAASAEAIARARELREQAAEMELGEAGDGHDLATMQEINRRRGAAVAESQKVLGQALGEMEANAALVYALRRGKSDKPFQVSLGNVSLESAVTQLRAIGLDRGDYMLDTVAGNRLAKITPGGLDKLASPVKREELDQVRRNLDIIAGTHDEEGWIPKGIVDRADLGTEVKPGVARQLAEPFEPADDLESSARAYIGGRIADGDQPADIVADLQSAEFFRKVGSDRSGEYRELLDRLAPLQDENGKMRQAESLRPAFEAMADDFVQARYGGQRQPIHRQSFEVDGTAMEALHRALSAEPTGVAAYKPVGELTALDQGALREYFAKHVARETPDAAALRRELEAMPAAEPERESTDMFGDTATNPEWTDWKGRRDDLAARVNASSMNWSKYVDAMHGPENAYAVMQDVVRSHVSRSFAEAHNTLNPRSPLKLGRATIRNNLAHLDAVDPSAAAARLAKEKALIDGLRNRVAGKYASGSVRDKLDAAREDEAGMAAAQMGFFSEEPAAADTPLGADERHSLGHVAERKIAEMMGVVGQNFRPGQPVGLFRPTMSGGNNWARQRAIKLIEANKRTVLSFGTGSGKTLIGLGGFSHLHEQGKVKRGLFLVPSIAQAGFHAEALRFLQPGKYKWHAKPGASREERIAAYKDPENHFAVMTHQSFRDDMIHLGARHAGISEEGMAAHLGSMPREQRASWLRGVMRREGISFDYLNVDEGHDTLNRRGKANSALANVVDALGDTAPYYVSASADPVKNDVSEAFSLLSKMDPARYTDQGAFMRRYGPDTLAAKEGLRRELARFQYPSKIDPDITATRSERTVPISEGQKKSLADLDRNVASARLARMQGKVDVAAMRAIAPSSFEGVDAGEHERLAGELQSNLGILKQTAVRHVLDAHAESGKVDDIVKLAREHAGKPGVVFAHSLAAVENIRARLASEGHRVATITGKDSAKDKGRKIAQFNPQKGAAEADILVASDAGATGANLQSGQWLVNFDTPDTAKTHAQRNGRINRIGQKNNVDLIDLVSDHPQERKARERLKTKYALRDALTTPMESLDDTGVAHFLRRRRIAHEAGGLF